MARGQITRRSTLTIQELADFLGVSIADVKAILGNQNEVTQADALRLRDAKVITAA